jgi:hypothetical protein
MSSGPAPSSIWLQSADLLTEAADFFAILPSRQTEGDREASVAEWERAVLEPELESALPAQWIAELCNTYLAELSFQLQSLAALLRSGNLAATIEIVIRAAVERVSRINWVLDPDPKVTPRIRAARASLEALRSLHYYRESFSRLGASTAETRRTIEELRTSRSFVASKFQVERPRLDPEDPNSRLTENVTEWVVEGETFPTFIEFAPWAIFGDDIPPDIAKGTYAGLSTFSHPSFTAAREHQFVENGRLFYGHDFDYVERLLRFAIIGFIDSIKRWIAYFNVDREATAAWISDFQDRWNRLTGTKSDSGAFEPGSDPIPPPL